jgi:hypothetical protein
MSPPAHSAMGFQYITTRLRNVMRTYPFSLSHRYTHELLLVLPEQAFAVDFKTNSLRCSAAATTSTWSAGAPTLARHRPL